LPRNGTEIAKLASADFSDRRIQVMPRHEIDQQQLFAALQAGSDRMQAYC
jgi:hypothetical protein